MNMPGIELYEGSALAKRKTNEIVASIAVRTSNVSTVAVLGKVS